MRGEFGGRRASGEAGSCLSWKAAHKPNLKHHSTQPALRFASTASAAGREPSRLSPAPKASCLRYPYSGTLRKTKRKGRGGIWICLRRKKRAKKQHSPQDSIALLACCGAGGFPVGHGKTPPASPSLPVESGVGALYLPSRYFQIKFNTIKTRSSCARQLQDFSAGYGVPKHQQHLRGL